MSCCFACRGLNEAGGLGDNTAVTKLSPVQVFGLTSGVSALSAGGHGACVVLSGSDAVSCWGYNNYGQVGDGSTQSRFRPVTTGLTRMTSTACGAYQCCALNSTSIHCWGYNEDGRLGKQRWCLCLCFVGSYLCMIYVNR